MATAEPPVKPVEQQNPGNPGLANWMSVVKDNQPSMPLATPAATAPNALATPPPAPVAASKPPEPPPTPPKAPEGTPAPSAEPEDADDKWPRTSDDWKKFKANRKAKETELSGQISSLTKERDELNTKLKGLNSFQDTPEYKSVTQERDQLSERLRILEVTQHPKFQAYFDSKTKAQIELAKRIVGNDRAEQISQILSAPDSPYKSQQLQDFVQELSVLDQSRIGGVLNSLADIDNERNGAIAQAKADGDAIKQRETQAREQAGKDQTARVNAFVDAKVKALTDPANGNPMFQKRDKDDAWNAAVEKRIESVKTILFGKVTPDEMFNAGANSVAYHQLLSDHQTLQKENNTLKEQLTKLSAAQPRLEGGGAVTGGGNGEPAPLKPKVGSNPMEASAAWAKGLQEAMRTGGGGA